MHDVLKQVAGGSIRERPGPARNEGEGLPDANRRGNRMRPTGALRDRFGTLTPKFGQQAPKPYFTVESW